MAGPLPLTEEFKSCARREWARLAQPGEWFDGTQRVSIAAGARRAMMGDHDDYSLPLSAPAREATRLIATNATSIRSETVTRWEAEGLSRYEYVEIIGIVSRLTALDTLRLALGHGVEALPDPEPGQATRLVADDAEQTNGWVPTVGPANPLSALTALPSAAEATHDVHTVLYLAGSQVMDFTINREISRAQMELVAARTSFLNECFY